MTLLLEKAKPRTGRYATIIPYIRGISPRETLLHWWLLLEECKGVPSIFWSQACAAETLRGDPIAFCAAFANRLACGIYANTTQNLVGFTWIEHIKLGHHAQFGMWYSRRAWGNVARDGTFLTTQLVFEAVNIQALYGFTPWKLALRHGLTLGWKHVGTLPGFAIVRDERRDMYVMLKEHDDE